MHGGHGNLPQGLHLTASDPSPPRGIRSPNRLLAILPRNTITIVQRDPGSLVCYYDWPIRVLTPDHIAPFGQRPSDVLCPLGKSAAGTANFALA